MKLIYWLLIIALFYYIINKFLDNYSTSEHFDPSLVPVSSIVTLAKVAQKIVTGNGTLTNPGNLNVAANLVIRDTSRFEDNVTISKNGLTVTGPITQTDNSANTLNGATTNNGSFTVSGTATIDGDITTNGKIYVSKDNGITFNGTSGISGNSTPSTYNISDDGNNLSISNSNGRILSFNKDGSINGNNNFRIDANSSLFATNVTTGGNLNMLGTSLFSITDTSDPNVIKAITFGDGTGKILRFQNNNGDPLLDLSDQGSLNFGGNLTVNGRSFDNIITDALNSITTA